MTSSLEGGGSGYPPKVMTSFSHDMMTRGGEGGVWLPPKNDDVIYEQPLRKKSCKTSMVSLKSNTHAFYTHVKALV